MQSKHKCFNENYLCVFSVAVRGGSPSLDRGRWVGEAVAVPIEIKAAIAVILRRDRTLICQRKAGDSFGGYWEFPGGGVEAGETLTQCLHRELREELNLTIEIVAPLKPVRHNISEGELILYPYWCRADDSVPVAIECDQFCWVSLDQLTDYQFPPGNESLFADIRQNIGKLAETQSDHR